jgi:hypothetical protein
MPLKSRVSPAAAVRRKGAQPMKKMTFRLTPDLREQLKSALESNPTEMTLSYEEELSERQLGQVVGGAVMVEYGLLVGLIAVVCSGSDPLTKK